MLVLLLGGCVDHIGKAAGEARRDLTSEALRHRLAAGQPVSAAAFPLGSQIQGRRCGGTLGTTDTAGLPGREPLMSSIAWATDGLIGKPFQPGQTFERQMRAASIRHDFCYGHGAATYGRTRKDCDLWLRADAVRLCSAVEGGHSRAGCTLRSDLPFLAVAPLGWTFYGDNLQATCEYDPGPNPPRDFVLPGRFLKAPGMLPGQVLHLSPEGGALRLRITGFRSGGASDPVTLLDAALPLNAVAIAPEPGRPCGRASCTLSGIGLTPQDLLELAPKVVDVDGDGLDELVLVAVEGLRLPSSPGYGMVALAVSLAAAPAADRLDLPSIVAGLVRTREERAGALPDGRLAPAVLRQQIDVLGQNWLTGRFLPSPAGREGGQQLLLAALRVEIGVGDPRPGDGQERGFAEFRVLHFPPTRPGRSRIGPPQLHYTRFRHDGVYFTAADGRGQLTELYRRFQNPPLVWQDAEGSDGVMLLARDWLDTRNAARFPVPDRVLKPLSQDRGMRVIAYGPATVPSGAGMPVPERNMRTVDGLLRRTGCEDLVTRDPDWLGCRRAAGEPPAVMTRFVWDWTREVNPVLALPDGTNRHAAVSLATAHGVDGKPLAPARESLVFFLTPPLHPHALRRSGPDDHRFVNRVAVLPAAGTAADGPVATEAGSWLNYPSLAARLGPAGEAGLALFRTVATGDGAAFEVAAAVPDVGGLAWQVTRSTCPVPPMLALANVADTRPGIEGGAMAHLRLSPVMRLPGAGARDDFVVATRERLLDGSVGTDRVAVMLLRADGARGWTMGGARCITHPRFE